MTRRQRTGGRTGFQLHEQQHVGPLPDRAEEFGHTRRSEGAPRTHLLAVEPPHGDLESRSDKVGARGRRLEKAARSWTRLYLFDGEGEAGVEVSSAVYFTVGTVLDELGENVLPPLLVLRVHCLDFLVEGAKSRFTRPT